MSLREKLITDLSKPTLAEGEEQNVFEETKRICLKLDLIGLGLAFLLRERQLDKLTEDQD